MTRTFENGNDWTTDQIMRQAESMTDIGERLERQLARQNEAVAEMRQIMLELKVQVDAVQTESRMAESRLRAGLQHEIFRLREEMCSFRRGPAPAPVVPPRPRPCGSRIFTAPLPSSAEFRSRASGETAASHEPYPSNPRCISYASQPSQRENNPASTAERSDTSCSGDIHKSEHNAGAGTQSRHFLRQVKSKTSLTILNKRAESKQDVPPVLSLSVSFPGARGAV